MCIILPAQVLVVMRRLPSPLTPLTMQMSARLQRSALNFNSLSASHAVRQNMQGSCHMEQNLIHHLDVHRWHAPSLSHIGNLGRF